MMKVTKTADAYLTCVNETGTNCNDVVIVFIICTAIVLVVLIAKWALLSWKKAESDYQEKEFLNKQKKDEVESLRKQKADLMGKKLEIYKEILEKRLEILKDLCYEEKLCDETEKTKKVIKFIKKFDSQEIIDYREFIEKELVPSEGESSQTLTQKYLDAIDKELEAFTNS